MRPYKICTYVCSSGGGMLWKEIFMTHTIRHKCCCAVVLEEVQQIYLFIFLYYYRSLLCILIYCITFNYLQASRQILAPLAPVTSSSTKNMSLSPLPKSRDSNDHSSLLVPMPSLSPSGKGASASSAAKSDASSSVSHSFEYYPKSKSPEVQYKKIRQLMLSIRNADDTVDGR